MSVRAFGKLLARWLRYLRVMFPPGRMLASAAALFLSVYFGLQALGGAAPLHAGPRAFIGVASTALWTLLIRLHDDLTDIAADRRLARAGDPRYRDRPTVRGAVTPRDLRSLSRVALAAFLGLNLAYGASWMLAACLTGWTLTWLGFRWFFVARWARDPGPLAYLARKGLTVLVAMYAAAAYVDAAGWVLSFWTVPLLLAPCAAVAAWEVGRKIRLPRDETAYATYSGVLGWRGATLLAGAFVLAACALLLPVAAATDAGAAYVTGLAAAALLALGACGRLLLRPTARHAMLGHWMQLFGAVAHAGLALALAARRGVSLS